MHKGMLSELQIDVIMMLSGAVWFGLVGGGLAGALAGALIRPMRTHHFFSFLPGSFCSALPAAAIAIGVSMLASIVEMILCKPGEKAGWDIPVWAVSAQAIAIFIAGVIGAFLAQHPRLGRVDPRRTIIWALAGSSLGTLACLGFSFDGYYVVQSNARPVCYAVIGIVIGGSVVLLWRRGIELLQGTTDEGTASAGP